MNDGKGWVYLVLASDPSHPVKIGYETRPHSRLASLQTGNPVKLSSRLRFPAFRDAERALHEAFAAYRQSGEWFSEREIIYHTFLRLHDLMEDKAIEMAGDDRSWSPYTAKVVISPEEAAREARHTIEYFAYARATDDWNLDETDAPAHLREAA